MIKSLVRKLVRRSKAAPALTGEIGTLFFADKQE